MAGKKTGPRNSPMTEEHRSKIGNSNILKRLIKHAEGDEDMKPSEVNAGLALLKKVMPDLKSIEHTGTGDSGEIVFQTIYETK